MLGNLYPVFFMLGLVAGAVLVMALALNIAADLHANRRKAVIWNRKRGIDPWNM